MNLRTYFSTRQTPQSQPIPGSTQTPNSAGGFAWAVDDWTRLDRFLILGAEGGTYYASERTLTVENASAVQRCVAVDGARAVARIVAISEAGRAPKNDPAIFALALAAGTGDDGTRRLALAALPRVCRTGTHLFHFAQYVEGFRGWGRGLREAIGAWYNALPAGDLAYQAVKYRQRDGWSHRDLLRLSHPKPASPQHHALYHWISRGWEWVGDEPHPDPALRLVWASERAARAVDEATVVQLVRDERLPREAVPTQWLTSPLVWEALLEDMPMTALIRNLATMTRVGLLAPGAAATGRVVAQLRDGTRLRKARVHPIAVLAALTTYASGRGVRGSGAWTPVPALVDALDEAFYASFGNVEPTGKRLLLALDVSGSMSMGMVAGVPGLTPRVASAALALVTAATEPNHQILGFSHELVEISISPRQRLDDVLKVIDAIPMGGTDCALPMLWAEQRRAQVDAFAIYTDSETWFGKIHPAQALRRYRDRLGIPSRLVVLAMTSAGFTIADPNDGGMLDVIGFDIAVPNLIADFIR
ncbi:MAG TPA: TROVE domain-containing protein [Chloroflexota bacterium]|nr:TROVE domain-containing protein [Chloroflexota bacterium]